MACFTQPHHTPRAARHVRHAQLIPIAQYARALRYFNAALSRERSAWLATHVIREARAHDLDARLIVALVAIESGWQPQAVSQVGARGLGQLMPSTAAELGVDAREPFANIAGTAKYLGRLRDAFAGYDRTRRDKYAIGAYNAGPGAAAFYHGIPPYPETRHYVVNVVYLWHTLCGARRRSSHAPALPPVPARDTELAAVGSSS